MKLKPLYFLLATIMISACNHNPYKETEKACNQQAKVFSKALMQKTVVEGNDTIKQPPFWVGTTNYNMRKPNFVIIHHTAQNSCEETLKTFPLPRTQVSGYYLSSQDGT